MKCERCYKETDTFICSMYNTENICMECKDAETKRADYKYACDVELEHVKSGDYNYKGIGLSKLNQ